MKQINFLGSHGKGCQYDCTEVTLPAQTVNGRRRSIMDERTKGIVMQGSQDVLDENCANLRLPGKQLGYVSIMRGEVGELRGNKGQLWRGWPWLSAESSRPSQTCFAFDLQPVGGSKDNDVASNLRKTWIARIRKLHWLQLYRNMIDMIRKYCK